MQMHTDEFLKGVDDQFRSELRKCSSLSKRMVVAHGCTEHLLGQFLHPHHLHHSKKWMFWTGNWLIFDTFHIRFPFMFHLSSSFILFDHLSSSFIIFHYVFHHPVCVPSNSRHHTQPCPPASIPDNFKVWMRSCQKFQSDGPRSTRLANEVENWILWDRDPYNRLV